MTALPLLIMRAARSGLLAFGLTVATGAWAGETFRKLGGGEITALLPGMELTDEVHWAYVFGKAGRLTSVSLGARGAGTWRVRNDELCLGGGPDGRRCFQVWSAGQRVELRHEGSLPDAGILQKPQARR